MAKKHPSCCVGQPTRSPARIRLEWEFWEALDETCNLDHVEYEELFSRIAKVAPRKGLTSAIRVFVLQQIRRREHAAQREVLRLLQPSGPVPRRLRHLDRRGGEVPETPVRVAERD